MDQGIWAGLNPFEHSMHPALGLSLSSSKIEVLVEVPSFDYTYMVNKYLFWIDIIYVEREASCKFPRSHPGKMNAWEGG